MNSNKNDRKSKLFKLLGFVVFSVFLYHLFASITYLFRDTQYENKYDDRIAVAGMKEEPKNSIDAVYVGGSATFMYWNTAQGYRDHGFTTYNLAVRRIQAESILPYVKYALKYQNPKLFIIDARAFQYYDDIGNEIGLRNTSDSFDIGIERFNLIEDFLHNRTETDADPLTLHLDIMKYHTNYAALSNSTAWALADNSIYCQDKGYQKERGYCYLEEPQGVKNDDRAVLPQNDERLLRELLDYFKAHNLNAFFVVCPYYITAEDYSKYNTISDIVASYGYDFLNTNDFYDEMDVDFTTDFYDINHMNVLGTDKYTNFLGEYLEQHYDLPDHRGDEKYAYWQEIADAVEENYTKWKKTPKETHDYAEEALEITEKMRNAESLTSWAKLAADDRFTLITVGKCGIAASSLASTYKSALKKIGLSDIYKKKEYTKLTLVDQPIESAPDEEGNLTATIGWKRYTVPCIVEHSQNEYIITIEEVEMARFPDNRVSILVFDNYHRTVADSVYLEFSGEEVIMHREMQ